MRQRRVAAGNGLSCVAAGSGLGAGLGTTITYVRPKLRPTNPPVEDVSPHVLPCLCAHEVGYIYPVPLLICRVFFS
jgi:hypothetical protein